MSFYNMRLNPFSLVLIAWQDVHYLSIHGTTFPDWDMLYLGWSLILRINFLQRWSLLYSLQTGHFLKLIISDEHRNNDKSNVCRFLYTQHINVVS